MTSYEQEARRRKAITISDWCRQTGLSADDVIAMNDVTRAQACKDARVNVASAQTWELVVGLLGALAATDRMHPAMRAALPDDPFEGIAPDDDFDPSEAELARYYHSGGGEDPVTRQQIRDAGRPGL